VCMAGTSRTPDSIYALWNIRFVEQIFAKNPEHYTPMALVLKMSGKRHGFYIFALACGSVPSRVATAATFLGRRNFIGLANEFEMRAAELDRALHGNQALRPWIDNSSPFAADH
jgi:hypothetical protein